MKKMTDTTQQYYIYENWQAHGHVARIHRAECSFCNFGKGFHCTDNVEHGRWLGPYKSLAEVYQKVNHPGINVSNCKICNPDLDRE
jgi:hypothetical protein